MKKGIVIGGGLAGLSAASYLAASGFNITLLEASPKLGGRAYSFHDDSFGCEIDNGQHLLMGCYKYTLDFFKLIGCYDNLDIQKNLKVNYIDEKGEKYFLHSFSAFYPFNLLMSLLNYKAITLAERMSVIRFFGRLLFMHLGELKNISIVEWLRKEGQSETTINALWELIAVSALNTSIHKASAKVFHDILCQIFLRGNFSTKIIFPKYGLTSVYCNAAEKFLNEENGEIILSEKVNAVILKNDKITEIITNKRSIHDFDFIVSAAPLYSLRKFFPDVENILCSNPKLEYSSIVSLHIKLKENPLEERYYGLISSPVHWVFNNKNYITIVISDADSLAEKNKNEIFTIVKHELKKYFGFKENIFGDFRIIKEKRATFIPSGDILNKRPDFTTKISNLFIAGDWTDTKLPSTIESAVKSGRKVSDYIIPNFS